MKYTEPVLVGYAFVTAPKKINCYGGNILTLVSFNFVQFTSSLSIDDIGNKDD